MLIQAKHQDGPYRRRSDRVEGSDRLIQRALFRAGRSLFDPWQGGGGGGPRRKKCRDFFVVLSDCGSQNLQEH